MLSGFETVFCRVEDYLASGGLVMGPLLVICLLMWFLIVDRLLFFKRLQRKKMSLQIALDHIQRNQLTDPQHYQGIIALLVNEFIQQRLGSAQDVWILDEIVQKLRRQMTAHLMIIGVLAAIAPLLGLLGTVTGMMATFDVLAVFGTGNSKAMANGISEALVTTQSGLLVAIPGLYMKSFLQQRAETVQQRLVLAGFYLRRHLGMADSSKTVNLRAPDND